MKHFHRWLFIPAILILIAVFLVLTGRVNIDIGLPLNTIGMIAAVVAGLMLIVATGMEARTMVRGWELPDPEEPPTTDKVIYPKPLDKAANAVEEAKKFSKRATDKVRIEIDVEDSRDD
jgi:hypothetical protein